MLMDNSTRVLPLFPAPLYVSKIKGLTKEKDFLIKQDYEGMDPQNGKISKECYDEADAIAVALTYILKER